MARKKEEEIICDECGHTCKVVHKEKQVSSHCPFCGESVTPTAEEKPLLNDFDALDEFEEARYYREDEDLENEE